MPISGSSSPLRALRPRFPLLLLGAGVLLTLYAAAEAYRTGKSNSALERRVLREYSSFVSWAYANAVETALRAAAREVIGAVNHGDRLHMSPMVPGAAELAHYLPFDDRCACHRPLLGPVPETFLAFTLGGDALEWAVNTHANPAEGWEIDRPLQVPVPVNLFTGYTPDERRSVVATITHVARALPDRENGFTYVVVPLERGVRVLAYTLMPTARGDTMVYGAQYASEAFARVLNELIDERELLPEPFRAGRRNRDVVEIGVTHDQHLVAGTVPATEFVATQSLSPRFASLEVHAAIKRDQVGTLVVGGLPRSRMPFVLGLLLLAASLTTVAVMQLRREDDLMRERAGWIASVSHELRTPLAQIRLYIDTVRLGRAPDDDRRRWALEQVDRETTRLGHLVEKVLSFSRFGRARREALQPELAADSIAKIVDEFRPLADARNVRIETTIAPVGRVAMRRDGLRHVLLNLLENAVKYGPAGQTVRVDLRESNGAIQLTVTDEGPGIPAAEREQVWRPFTRGTASAEQGGSGIGLAVVREVATEAGGTAWIESSPNGHGARFVVSIPLATDAA